MPVIVVPPFASPLQGLLDAKLLRPSEDPAWKETTQFGKTKLLENLMVFTGRDVRDLARRIVSSVNAEHLINDRDLKYRIFRAQHLDPALKPQI